MCDCKGTYATKFGYVGVSGTPSTGKCGGVCEGRGKPLEVRDAGMPIGSYQVTEGVRGGLGERASERAYEVLLEHIRGLVEDVAELKGQIAALRQSHNEIHWCETHMAWEHGVREEPDYMPGDFRPGR